MPDLIDLTGQPFGRWTVMRLGDPTAALETRWECRCECGRIRLVRASFLRSGVSGGCRSCAARDRPHDSPAQRAHHRSLTQPQWERVCLTCGTAFTGTARQKYCRVMCRPSRQ